jgi:hypothetical protein
VAHWTAPGIFRVICTRSKTATWGAICNSLVPFDRNTAAKDSFAAVLNYPSQIVKSLGLCVAPLNRLYVAGLSTVWTMLRAKAAMPLFG